MKKFRIRKCLILMAGVLGLVCVSMHAPAEASLYNGSLVYSTGINAGYNNSWAVGGTNPTTLEWDISYNSEAGTYHYIYHFQVGDPYGAGGPEGDLYRFILEVPTDVTQDDFFNFTNAVLTWDDPKVYSGSVGMPGELFGIKLKDDGETSAWGTDVLFSFDSTLAPGWGDFYARDVEGIRYAYNKGFLLPDSEDSSHIGVPNTLNVVPIPNAIWFLFFCLISFFRLKRRF